MCGRKNKGRERDNTRRWGVKGRKKKRKRKACRVVIVKSCPTSREEGKEGGTEGREGGRPYLTRQKNVKRGTGSKRMEVREGTKMQEQ